MKISDTWFQTLTAPFPVYSGGLDNVGRSVLEQYEPKYIAITFRLGNKKAQRLALVVSEWERTMPGYGLSEALTSRLHWCSMRFSHWRIKYRRRCDRAKICPWCRQLLVLNLYSKLVGMAQQGLLGVLVNVGPVEDRKKLARAPAGTLAAVRNIWYPHTYSEPEFKAVFFLKLGAGSPAEPCDKIRLKYLLGSTLGWDYSLMVHTGADKVLQYIDLLQGTRLWSLNI